MLTSYDKKRYTYLKENFDKLYPTISQKVLSESSTGVKILFALATTINFFCLCRTINIMFSFSPIYNLFILIISYLVGDIVSGFIHWIFDTYDIHPFMLTHPYLSTYGHILQESFDGFRLHHIMPHTIVTHTLFNTIGSTFILVAFVQAFAMLLNLSPFLYAFIGLISSVNIFANEFHKISHMDKNQMSFIRKIVASTNIFLTKERHRAHHRFEREEEGYTMLSGLFNPLLDHPNVRLWSRLEDVMFYLFGIKSFRMVNKDIEFLKQVTILPIDQLEVRLTNNKENNKHMNKNGTSNLMGWRDNR
jgi:hypothetical protein